MFGIAIADNDQEVLLAYWKTIINNRLNLLKQVTQALFKIGTANLYYQLVTQQRYYTYAFQFVT